MSSDGRRMRAGIISLFVVSAGFAFASCASEETPDDSANVTQESPDQAVDIPGDTLVGEQSQRIVDLLNSDEETTAEDFEGHLHSSFTAEVSGEELVELFNQNLRPAQPFTVTDYEGGERQAVSVLTSPVSDAIDMTVHVDNDGLITGLLFTPSESDG